MPGLGVGVFELEPVPVIKKEQKVSAAFLPLISLHSI